MRESNFYMNNNSLWWRQWKLSTLETKITNLFILLQLITKITTNFKKSFVLLHHKPKPRFLPRYFQAFLKNLHSKSYSLFMVSYFDVRASVSYCRNYCIYSWTNTVRASFLCFYSDIRVYIKWTRRPNIL